MRIALCDDEAADRQAIYELALAFGQERGLEFEIDTFSSGEDFLASSGGYDIVFMDIYLTGASGLETVKRIGHSPARQVVFTTSSREHAIEAFGMDAAHYLVKPLTAGTVAAAMERCLNRLGRGSGKPLLVRTSQGTVPVPMEKIVYIEVLDKLCTVHTEKNMFRTYTSLGALFEQLDGSFLRVQRSYAVNMAFIESFLFDRVVMQDGTEIMLSRNNRPELKRRYQNYLFRLARSDKI